ncbi:hypothetical protein [Caulobacter sp. NIBR2454]|uniref:hypothetical protein n=1 Tax=Caulobacter sp. NIBR2454 TaxID=3015996 RepID=UPI0022B6963F|nr:hypothetical protein [Caulobacter sp. NIBR2454]
MPLQPIKILHRGQTWNGHWSLEGRALKLDSAYGSVTLDARRRRPEIVAAEALTEMVDQWCKSATAPARTKAPPRRKP